MSYKELNMLLAKAQTDRDTEGTALDHTHFQMCGNDFELSFKRDQNEIPAAIGQFGSYQNVPGGAQIDFKGFTFLSTNGIDSPMFEIFLLACGFKLTRSEGTPTTGNTTLSDATVTGVASTADIEVGTLCGFSKGFASTAIVNEVISKTADTLEMTISATSTETGADITFYTRVRTYAPSSVRSEWTWLTMWGYTGVKAADESTLTIGYSMLLDGVIEGTLGEVIKLSSLTGKGVPSAEPAAATYPSTVPTLPSDTIGKMLKASAATFLSQNYDILKFQIAFKNKVELELSPTVARPFGYYAADIRGSDMELTMTVYQTVLGTSNPYPPLTVGTLGTFDIVVGAVGSKIELKSPSNKFQIQSVTPSADGGQNCWEIKGKLTKQNFNIITGA